MCPEISIRAAIAADAAEIAALVQLAYQGYIERLGKAPAPMLVDYEHAVAVGKVHVAVRDSEIVGLVVLSDTDQGFLLDNVAVAPARQGQGIGRCLIRFAEAQALAHGRDRIALYTHEKMTENLQLYQRLGYRDVAVRRAHGYTRVYMEKSFSE